MNILAKLKSHTEECVARERAFLATAKHPEDIALVRDLLAGSHRLLDTLDLASRKLAQHQPQQPATESLPT